MEAVSTRYPDVAPTIVIDREIGDQYELDFDVESYVEFLHQVGISDSEICKTTIRIEKPDKDSRDLQKECGPLYGQFYTHPNNNLRIYWDTISKSFTRPTEKTQSQMNKTLVHESGHLLDEVRSTFNAKWRRKTKRSIENGLGTGSLAVIGGSALMAAARLGPKAISEKLSGKPLKVSDTALLTGSIALATALGIDCFYETKLGMRYWKDYSVGERFARRFEKGHKDRVPTFIKLTSIS